ncbi:MAG: family 43 glycosylhydrolase [Muribaculaceae bacterium]
MKRNSFLHALIGALALASALCGCSLRNNNVANSQNQQSAPRQLIARALNPIVPPGVYIADPEARVMPDGRIYVYGSRDVPQYYWCSKAYHVLSSDDMVNWHIEQFSFATEGIGKQADYTTRELYAPDCIYHNGKYYLYYCLSGDKADDEGVAISNSPYGPFRNGQIIKGAEGIDPSVFIDDDGQAYLYWGQGYAKGAKLSSDMTRLEGAISDSLLTYEVHAFNEASSVRKRGGIYYYIYGGHQRHGESNCATLNYATSTSPLGPFTYRGVIIDNYNTHANVVNNHGSIVEIDGNWYIFYHRPTHGSPTMRKVCVEPIKFNPDGTIQEMEMTTQGVGGPLDPLMRMDAARACQLSGNLTVHCRRPADDIPVEYLANIRHGDYAIWRYYDFDLNSATHFMCKTWGNTLDADIEIRLDSPQGTLLGTCQVGAMQGEVAYEIHSTNVAKAQGEHALVLVFKSTSGKTDADLMNLEWLRFTK